MPWTAQGPYVTTGPFTSGNANNIELQYSESTLSLEQDMLSAFIIFGFIATKDGTTFSQLDVTAGAAMLLQTDSTLRRRSAGALNYSTTGHASTTMFLDLNPDGTWSWATTHSAIAGHLTIASATTDASANILVVTDARTLGTTLLPNAIGSIAVPNALFVGGFGGAQISWNTIFANVLWYGPPNFGGSANGQVFNAWDGAAGHSVLSIGGQFGGASAWVDNSGNYVTLGFMLLGAAESGSQTQLFYSHANLASSINTPQAGASALGIAFGTWTGAAQAIPLSIGGQFISAKSWFDNSGNLHGGVGAALPTNRNGTATSVEVYTGANTPVGDGVTTPRTGAIWIKA